ncbi:MAG: DUF6624 domain-containing protein [Ignavibacteriota bacterium]
MFIPADQSKINLVNDFSILISLCEKDLNLRQELIAKGKLFGEYNPEMEALHIENGKHLENILSKYGWPNEDINGQEVVAAAWTITMHAISLPSLQKRVLALFKKMPEYQHTPLAAMLEDRILVFSGSKQFYGTQVDCDEKGILNPFPIQDIDKVDERRKSVNLPPLKESLDKLRARAVEENERPPEDISEYARKRRDWMRRVGWV